MHIYIQIHIHFSLYIYRERYIYMHVHICIYTYYKYVIMHIICICEDSQTFPPHGPHLAVALGSCPRPLFSCVAVTPRRRLYQQLQGRTRNT